MSRNDMTPRERILAALNGEPTDRVPYQEVFFGHRAFAEHFGGPQDSPQAAARYLRESGQCSYLVGGFWWVPGAQTKELFDLSTRVAQQTFETLNATAAKSFEQMKKA